MPKDAQQWWTEELAAAIVGRPDGKSCKSLVLLACQRPAKPRTAVRFRSRPPLRKKKSALLALFLCRKCGRSTLELSGGGAVRLERNVRAQKPQRAPRLEFALLKDPARDTPHARSQLADDGGSFL